MLAFARPPLSALRGTRARGLHLRCENILTVTGPSTSVDAFRAAVATAPPPLVADAATRPVHAQLWASCFVAREPLSFQSHLPTASAPAADAWPWNLRDGDDAYERQRRWGCSTDALRVAIHQGRPRLRGRSSLRYEFETGDAPPLRWLHTVAAAHAALRLGFKYAVPQPAEAHEMAFLQGRMVFKTQVSVASWMWSNRVQRPEFFSDLLDMLRLTFPDGRLPKKRRITAEDVEARLLASGELSRAVELLHASIRGWAGKSRLKKLWRGQVLPEFVAWLHGGAPPLALAEA